MKYLLVTLCIVITINSFAQEDSFNRNGLEFSFSPVHLSNKNNVINKIKYINQGYTGKVEINDIDITKKVGFSLGYRFTIYSINKYRNFLKLSFSKHKSLMDFEEGGISDDGFLYNIDYDVSLTNKMIGLVLENEYNLTKNIAASLALGLNRNFLKFNEKIQPNFSSQFDKENEETKKSWLLDFNLGLRYYATDHLSFFTNARYLKFPKTEIERSAYRIEKIEGNWIIDFWVSKYEYCFDLSSMNLNFGISYDF